MTTPAFESLPGRNSDPIWLQDYFVHTGHDADTRSGTATFVRRKGIHYVYTCRHIMEGIKDPKWCPTPSFRPWRSLRAGCPDSFRSAQGG